MLATWGVIGLAVALALASALTFFAARNAERDATSLATVRSADGGSGGSGRMRTSRTWVLGVWMAAVLGIAVIAAITATWLNERWAANFGTVVTAQGFLDKLSYKGWVCKTWEGELVLEAAPGDGARALRFTARRRSAVDALRQALGHEVAITYVHRTRVWSSCLGDAADLVEGVGVSADPLSRPGL